MGLAARPITPKFLRNRRHVRRVLDQWHYQRMLLCTSPSPVNESKVGNVYRALRGFFVSPSALADLSILPLFASTGNAGFRSDTVLQLSRARLRSTRCQDLRYLAYGLDVDLRVTCTRPRGSVFHGGNVSGILWSSFEPGVGAPRMPGVRPPYRLLHPVR